MASRELIKAFKQERRQRRVRKKVLGTADRPRLCVYRSLLHVYAQLIDDVQGRTLASCSSLDKALLDSVKAAKNKSDASFKVGESLGKKALEQGIEDVVFDRNRYQYHGRVKALAEGARKAGLRF
jgi:large subunit ribosomal protein L18